jgi:glyoxylase-like metal-dependent hydrolase (beta-lactamase superfamily II)
VPQPLSTASLSAGPLPRLPATLRFIERNWLSSNNIVFVDGADTAVVDTGYLSHVAQTLQLVEHALEGKPLRRIVNTHAHSDHVGGNAALTARYGCTTTMPSGYAEVVREWQAEKLPYETTGQRCDRYGCDTSYQAGNTLELGGLHWQALATPGHDMDSLALYCEEERILISADALWQNGFGLLFPNLELGTDADAVAAQRATLESLAKLEVRVVLPGHGAPFTGFHSAIEGALSKLAYLAGDPVRQGRLALKVMLSFRLMEEGRVAVASLPHFFASHVFWSGVNAKFFNLDHTALAELACQELVKTGAATIENGYLVGRA